TPEDLDRIIARSHADGLLDDDTYRLLDRGLAFRSLTAAEVMMPRVDVVTLRADDRATRVVDAMDTGHTRFPVIGESVDDIIGVISVGDVADLDPAARPTTPIRARCARPVLVAATTPVPKVLERLRCERQQLACVIDEYGGLAGVITLEDIAEELVGDIRDEDDLPGPALISLGEGWWRVPGRWRPDEIAEATGIALPEDPTYDTLSGLVLARLGRIPIVGDQVTIDLPPVLGEGDETARGERVTLEVATVTRHVPGSVLVHRVGPAPIPADQPTPAPADQPTPAPADEAQPAGSPVVEVSQ
ncbi:MAG: CBS domain-containing protein, partial [Micromonosporaceae bacterium]|nr:CBS domain-containing protein [Micromonosporaceae bacterium]